MRDFKDKVALVTGAGSGIGRETALALARRGAKLIVCDVNEVPLREIESELNGIGECVLAEVVDVSNRHAMRAFAEAIHDQVPALDILVNNAGVGLAGGFLDTDLEDWDWIVGINLMGVVHGCHFFIPRMVERGQGGHVVNISSLAGYFVAPDLTAYLTTKFGVFGLTEALREELRPHGIGASTICPGIINTAIVNTSRFKKKGVDVDAMRQKIDAEYVKRNYGPDRVASAIVKAIERNRGITPVSPESWLAYYVNRFHVGLSRFMARMITSRMMD